MSTERVDLVCVDRKRSSRNWDITSEDQRVIPVSSVTLLSEAFRRGVREFAKDIRRVIFDRSIDAASFLQFLSELPVEYRGDVLSIGQDGRSFLSAPAPRGDGRVLFSLSADDLEFYLATAYLTISGESTVAESNYYKMQVA